LAFVEMLPNDSYEMSKYDLYFLKKHTLYYQSTLKFLPIVSNRKGELEEKELALIGYLIPLS
jgi:hypothetical protein